MSVYTPKQKIQVLGRELGWNYREAFGALYLLVEYLKPLNKPTLSVSDVYHGCRCDSMPEAAKIFRALFTSQIYANTQTKPLAEVIPIFKGRK